MTDNKTEQERALAAINTVVETNGVLVAALRAGDSDKAHEAVSVMLLQVTEIYGRDSVAFTQFFPVMDVVQRRIAGGDLAGALRQSESFNRQLFEIRALVGGG